MNYNFDIDIEMTAKIDSKVALQMITAAIEKQTGRKVINISPKIDGNNLTGYHVDFDAYQKRQAFKPSTEFIVENFGAED